MQDSENIQGSIQVSKMIRAPLPQHWDKLVIQASKSLLGRAAHVFDITSDINHSFILVAESTQ